MPRLEEFKAELRDSWPDKDVYPVCEAIVDYLFKTPSAELKYLTFYTFRNVTGRAENDDCLLRAVSILTNSSRPTLDLRLRYEDGDEHFEVERALLRHARATGEFIHPETGEPVPDYERKLYTFFVPTKHLFAMKEEVHGED